MTETLQIIYQCNIIIGTIKNKWRMLCFYYMIEGDKEKLGKCLM